MRAYESRSDLLDAFRPYGEVHKDGVHVSDAHGLRGEFVDNLAYTSALGADVMKLAARHLIWELAQILGCPPASIHDYYIAGGRNVWHNQTTPAINVRAMAYDTARSIARAANKLDVGQVIFEIARSEMGYTEQRRPSTPRRSLRPPFARASRGQSSSRATTSRSMPRGTRQTLKRRFRGFAI